MRRPRGARAVRVQPIARACSRTCERACVPTGNARRPAPDARHERAAPHARVDGRPIRDARALRDRDKTRTRAASTIFRVTTVGIVRRPATHHAADAATRSRYRAESMRSARRSQRESRRYATNRDESRLDSTRMRMRKARSFGGRPMSGRLRPSAGTRATSSPAVIARSRGRHRSTVRSGLLDTRARIERRTGFDARAADCEPRFAQSWRRRRPIRPSPIAPNARQAARIPSPERLTCIKPAITDGPHPLDKRNSARRLGAHVFAVRTEKSPCETLFIDGRAP